MTNDNFDNGIDKTPADKSEINFLLAIERLYPINITEEDILRLNDYYLMEKFELIRALDENGDMTLEFRLVYFLKAGYLGHDPLAILVVDNNNRVFILDTKARAGVLRTEIERLVTQSKMTEENTISARIGRVARFVSSSIASFFGARQ